MPKTPTQDHSSEAPPSVPGAAGSELESRLAITGRDLHRDFTALLADLGQTDKGPQALAKRLGVDKVLASRLLKALRTADPFSVLTSIPGPEPLRRVLKGGAKVGVDPKMLEHARRSVDQLEAVIRDELGDRAALDTIVSAWVPEAKRAFEARRLQSIYRANAELRGVRVDTLLAAAVFVPSTDPERNDLAWIHGLLGLRRLRPGASVRLASRRMTRDTDDRRPTNLAGEPIDRFADMLIADLCTENAPDLETVRTGEVIEYRLRDDRFGPGSDADLVLGEINPAELPRYAERERRSFAFTEVSIPAKSLCFDLFVHKDLFPGQTPAVTVHDTAFGGVVDLNDPSREGDRLDLSVTMDDLGAGLRGARLGELPSYTDALARIADRTGHTPDALRGYRVRMASPLYGTQVSMSFRAALRPDAG